MSDATRPPSPIDPPWTAEDDSSAEEVYDRFYWVKDATGNNMVLVRAQDDGSPPPALAMILAAPEMLAVIADLADALRQIRDDGPGLIAQHGDALDAGLTMLARFKGEGCR